MKNLFMNSMKLALNFRQYWAKGLKCFQSTMSDKIVYISNADIPQSAIDLLSERFKTVINQEYTKEGNLKNVPGANAIYWSTKVKLDKDILDAAGPQLEVVSTASAGLDHIDVQELKKRGIKLSNTPIVLNATVADIAVLLALAASRRLHEGRLHIENGTWEISNNWMLGQGLSGSTVGIVGLGGIGQAILKRLKAFEVRKFVYSGHSEKEEGKELGAQFVSFDQLLKVSDFIIVSCPLTPETKEMFNESAFSQMKKTSVFVNVGRGGIVDQPALAKALREGTIFAAGLDVMTPEPLPANDELLSLPNCVLLPHFGSATVQTRTAMAELTAKNIIMVLGGGELLTPVY